MFPSYKIPSFLHFYASNSFACAKFLIENEFIPKLIYLLLSCSNKLDDSEDFNQEEEFIEDDGNFLDYILCAGSICDINQYKDQLLPLGPVLTSIILNETDWKIQCEAINSLSTLLKNVEAAAKEFLSNESLLSIVSPSICESNIHYLTSVINLFGSLLQYPQYLDDSLYYKILSLFLSSLNNFKDKCDKGISFESCISLIANSIADGCSESNPNFTQLCLECGIVQTFFEIFNDENPWNLKINIFEAILKLFYHGLPDVESLDAFIELGFIDLLLNNLSEMCPCNGFAITSALLSIISFVIEIGSDEYSLLIDFLLSVEVEEAVDMLTQSDDIEIKSNAEKVDSFIQSLYEDK